MSMYCSYHSFQSAPPVKGATQCRKLHFDHWRFQSAPPVKGATQALRRILTIREFQSAPPVKGATRLVLASDNPVGVSIRAPREGGDTG